MTTQTKELSQAQHHRATRHGLRASSLPPGCRYIEGQLMAFRRYLRDELTERNGSTSTYEEALMQSAVRHETRGLLAARWLRKECNELNINERLALLKEIGKSTNSRDKCLRELNLDRNAASSAIDVLYAAEIQDDHTDPDAQTPPNEPQSTDSMESSDQQN